MRNGKHNMIWLGTIRALICKNWWFKDDQAWLKLLSTSPQLTCTWVVGIPPSKWQAWHFMTRSNTSGFSIATFDYPLGHVWPNRNSIIHVAAPAAPPLSFAGNAASKGMVTIKMAYRGSPLDFFGSTWCETGKRWRFVWNRVPLNPLVNHG